MKFLVLILALSAFAKTKVIDVGDIEVKGEVRKPFVTLLDSEQATKALLPRISEQELKDFEAKMLEFRKPQ